MTGSMSWLRCARSASAVPAPTARGAGRRRRSACSSARASAPAPATRAPSRTCSWSTRRSRAQTSATAGASRSSTRSTVASTPDAAVGQLREAPQQRELPRRRGGGVAQDRGDEAMTPAVAVTATAMACSAGVARVPGRAPERGGESGRTHREGVAAVPHEADCERDDGQGARQHDHAPRGRVQRGERRHRRQPDPQPPRPRRRREHRAGGGGLRQRHGARGRGRRARPAASRRSRPGRASGRGRRRGRSPCGRRSS